jgi:hypothetical protein
VRELDALATKSLGDSRSRRVTRVLKTAELSEASVEAAIDQISRMSITFVDPVRMADLADEMRIVLARRVGRPPPGRQSGVPRGPGDNLDPGVTSAFAAGCQSLLLLVVNTFLLAICLKERIADHYVRIGH